MPILVPSNELRPGMSLADPVRYGGRTLLTANKRLTHTDIRSLQKRFSDLLVRVADPILDEITEFEDDSDEREVANTVRSMIADAMSEVQERYTERTALTKVNFAAIQTTIAKVIAYLQANPVSAALLTRAIDDGNYMSHHTGNVFYLSMLLGSTVREYILQERLKHAQAKGMSHQTMLDLTPLGLGAMFMDVGMLPLRHLFEEERTLTEEDREYIHEHPLIGADMLPDSFSAVGRAIVKTHHENWDGSGYPAGLARERLHVFARIARIADAYDAATSSQIYQRAKTPARALWEMTVGPYRYFYDPTLMTVFARLIQPFPIGAKLRLTDGRYAVVVKYNRKNPFQPHVIIAFDRDNNRLPNSRLEGPFALDKRPRLHLAYWGDENLAYIRDDGLDQFKPVRSSKLRTLFDASYP